MMSLEIFSFKSRWRNELEHANNGSEDGIAAGCFRTLS